jgi:molybdopterin-containing oxidoreductase family membrane subunit
MRRDIAQIARMPLRFRKVYELLALGYRDTEASRRRHDAVLFWLAIALVPIMVSVHSVYGFFFGLLGSRAGWYNPLQPPYFVLGAVVSGFSALIVVMASVRKLLGWRELLVDRTFRVFGAFLAFVVFLYLYFVFSEHVTAQFAAPPGERAVSSALLTGRYAGLFWATVAGGLLAPFFVLFVQAVRKKEVSVPAVVSAALVVNAAMLLKRVLLVLPPQQIPNLPLPMDPGVYRPTLLELTTTFGTYAFGGLLFVLLLCALPMVELPLGPAEEPSPAAPAGGSARRISTRRIAIAATVAAGVALIAWGVATRDHDLAPLKWILGLVLLATSPLQVSLEVER